MPRHDRTSHDRNEYVMAKRSVQRAAAVRNTVQGQTTKVTAEWLPVASLVSLHFRPTSKTKVRAIAAEFDPDALGVLYISRRDDGTNYVLDGDNRIEALRTMGWVDQRVPTHVYHGLTQAREAELFVEFNQKRTKPKPVDIFQAQVKANDEQALAITKVLATRGLVVSIHKTHGNVMAVQALQTVFNSAGGRVLGEVLDIASNAWGKGHQSFQADILWGIGVILARYGKRVNPTRLSKRLARYEPGTIVTQARMLKQAEHGGQADNRSGSYVARNILNVYNSGLRNESKLTWDQSRSGPMYWAPVREA